MVWLLAHMKQYMLAATALLVSLYATSPVQCIRPVQLPDEVRKLACDALASAMQLVTLSNTAIDTDSKRSLVEQLNSSQPKMTQLVQFDPELIAQSVCKSVHTVYAELDTYEYGSVAALRKFIHHIDPFPAGLLSALYRQYYHSTCDEERARACLGFAQEVAKVADESESPQACQGLTFALGKVPKRAPST